MNIKELVQNCVKTAAEVPGVVPPKAPGTPGVVAPTQAPPRLLDSAWSSVANKASQFAAPFKSPQPAAPAPAAPPAVKPPAAPPAPAAQPKDYNAIRAGLLKKFTPTSNVNDVMARRAEYLKGMEGSTGIQQPTAADLGFDSKGQAQADVNKLYEAYGKDKDAMELLNSMHPESRLAVDYGTALDAKDQAAMTGAMNRAAELAKSRNPNATPEQLAEKTKTLQQQVFEQGSQAKGGFLGQVAEVGQPGFVANKVKESVGDAVVEQAGKFKQTNAAVADKIKNGGILDWIKADPSVLAIPAGILAMVFGGKPGLILGAMATAYGAKGMYDRYNHIKSPEFAKTYKKFIDGLQNSTPEELAKLDLNTLETTYKMTPQDAMGVRDMLALTSTPLARDYITKKFNQSAIDAGAGALGAAATPEMQQAWAKRLSEQDVQAAKAREAAIAAQTQNQTQTALGQ